MPDTDSGLTKPQGHLHHWQQSAGWSHQGAQDHVEEPDQVAECLLARSLARADWRMTVLSELASGHMACSRAHLALPCPVQHHLLRGSGHLWHHRGNHPANKDRLGAAVAGHWAVVKRVLPGGLRHIRVRPDHRLGEPCLRVTALQLWSHHACMHTVVLTPSPATANDCTHTLWP